MRGVQVAAFLAALVMTAGWSQAAVLNSLSGWSEENPGWSGMLAGSYGASGGNSPNTSFEGSGRVQWLGSTNVVRFLASGNRKTTDGVETKRSAVAHLRHNYLLTDMWATLVFAQIQKNPFQRLDSRILFGLGGRWRGEIKESTRIYLGASHMFEQESILDEPGHEKAQRLSTFVGVVSELSEIVNLDLLLFYQPRWSNFADWRMSFEATLEVELTEKLLLFTGYRLEYNAMPPEGVEKNDWDTKTGFAFKF
jgi:putative salt-induced outer membrane protein YdiY